jgi:acyl dehydratase
MTTFAITAPSFDEVEIGQQIPNFERTPTKAQLVMYAGAEDDYMPVHFDHQYAVAAGQPGVINHGWLTYAILLQAVTSWLPAQVATIVATDCRYVRPAFPEQVIRCTGTVTAKSADGGSRRIDVAVVATNPAGELTTRTNVTLEFA